MKRNTQQREAIREALTKAGRPLTVDEILELAQTKVAGLGIATVYRNLKALQDEGWTKPVDLAGQPPRWEMAQPHHHHFLCNTCDKVFDIGGCPEGLTNILPDGYTLAEHDLLLRGQCDTCARKPKTRRG